MTIAQLIELLEQALAQGTPPTTEVWVTDKENTKNFRIDDSVLEPDEEPILILGGELL